MARMLRNSAENTAKAAYVQPIRLLMRSLPFRLAVLILSLLKFSPEILLAQRAELVPSAAIRLPGLADSNSPAHWRDGQLFVFNSIGMPIVSSGDDVSTLGSTRAVLVSPYKNVPMWIESTWIDDDGTIYAWYHHEPGVVCSGTRLTAPKIGAAFSQDGGYNFTDLGIVIESSQPKACDAENGYFAGGTGDFTVVADRENRFFYFFYSSYDGSVSQQGIAVARMRMEDRLSPVGRVWRYFRGDWRQPGLGGDHTPILAARSSWSSSAPDAFWGPSLHWNTHLNRFVMLMNRTCCGPGWPQEGVYISYNENLSDVNGWTFPEKLMEGGGWYPQIIGLGDQETDKEAGRRARFFTGSVSEYEIVFRRPEEAEDQPQLLPKHAPAAASANHKPQAGSGRRPRQ